MSGSLVCVSAKERKDHQRVRLHAGSRANRLRLRQVGFGHDLVASVEIKGRQTVVAREEELGLPNLLGEGQRLLVHGKGLAMLAVALVDLTEHDQGHGEVIEEAQSSVEIDGSLRRLDPFGLASIG